MTIRKGIRIVVLLPTTATTSTASATSTANTASSSSATSASNNHSTMSRTSTSSTGTTSVRVGDHTMESVHPCLWNYGKVGALTFSDFCMCKLMCLQYTFVFVSVHMCALTLPKTCVSVTVCSMTVYCTCFCFSLWVWFNQIPSWKLTYPKKNAFWRWFSFSQGGIC